MRTALGFARRYQQAAAAEEGLPTELRALCGAFHQLALELVGTLDAQPGQDVGELARALLARFAGMALSGGDVWLQMGAQQLLALASALLPASRRAGGLQGPPVGRWMCDEMDPALVYHSLWYDALVRVTLTLT